MSESLTFPPADQAKLSSYLPPSSPTTIFVTLTFATSLDSSLSLAPGIRTRLSGPTSKAMTHYLRSRHSAILIGVNTAIADDPGLNCRISGSSHQPRPVIIDPRGRWEFTRENKIFQCCRNGMGLGPLVVVAEGMAVDEERERILREVGGRHVAVAVGEDGRFEWREIFDVLIKEGLKSVMVEGGGSIINDLLSINNNKFIDSAIVTIAPTWLGQGGVVVSPPRVCEGETQTPVAAARLKEVMWHPFGQDVVLCGRIE